MLKKQKTIKILFIISLLFGQLCYSANIIFDLGGVLIQHGKSHFINQINIKSFITYLIKLNNPLLLKHRLFELLRNIPASKINTFYAGDGDENGKKLPDIMCEWLTGDKTSNQIKNLALDFLENKPDFCNPGEKDIFIQLINLMFTPLDFSKSSILSQEGLKFVKKCKDSGHKLFILSNWDLESSFIITKQFPELFDLFDQNNIVFSGRIGLIKPDPKIYEYLIEKYNLDPKECIFFDDQAINVESAKKAGIYSVICKNAKCTDMIKELNKFTKTIALENYAI